MFVIRHESTAVAVLWSECRIASNRAADGMLFADLAARCSRMKRALLNNTSADGLRAVCLASLILPDLSRGLSIKPNRNTREIVVENIHCAYRPSCVHLNEFSWTWHGHQGREAQG